MTELTKLEYLQALDKAHEDPESYKIIEKLIGEHIGMLNHMKKTSLWDVYTYEETLTKFTLGPVEIITDENKRMKKEINKLRKQLGVGTKYKTDEDPE